MTERYKSPVPAAPEYIFALGQAIYSFSTLEWMVVWVAEKISPGFIYSDHATMMAGTIAKNFRTFVKASQTRLPDEVWKRLKACSDDLWHAIELRKDLLHAHPYTAEGGVQQLIRRQPSGSFAEWNVDKIDAATKYFDDLSRELNGLFYNHLSDPDLIKELNDNMIAAAETSEPPHA